MKHEDYKELLTLVVLDALDAPACSTLATHLVACAQCRTEFTELQATASLLAHTITPVKPAPALRTRLLAQLKTTPQTSGSGSDTTTAPGATAAQSETGRQSPAAAPNVLPFAPRRTVRARALATFGALAAALAIAALASALISLWSSNRQLHVEVARLTTDAQQTQQTLTDLRAERDLLAAPDARLTELAGTNNATNAHARLTYDERTGKALLVATGLPAPPPGKAYQLWFIADGRPLPGSVFGTDATGRAELREQIPTAGRRAQSFAVTLEPQAGVPAPTGQMYLKSAS